jgi:FkbM family methyltransferase
MPQWINRPVKAAFGVLGLEVRLRSRVRMHMERQRKERQRDGWRVLANYPIHSVIDIGANVGQFATLISEIVPDAELHCFEPLASCYAELERAVQALPRVRCYNVALGNSEGTCTMHHNDFSPSSSLLPMAALHKEELPHTTEAQAETVRIAALDRFFPDGAIQQLHFRLIRAMIGEIAIGRKAALGDGW